MSRKFHLDLDDDSLRVIDPNEKPVEETEPTEENESNNMIDPNQEKLADTDVLFEEQTFQEPIFEEVIIKPEPVVTSNEFIDVNQISLTDEVNNVQTNELRITDFNSNKPTKTKTEKVAKPLMITTLFVNLFFAVWLFVVVMVPPLASNVGNITTIYFKFAQDSSSFSFTAVGYVNLILFTIPVFVLNIANLALRLKTKEVYFYKLNKKAKICFETFRYLLILSIILMDLNLLIPPFGINDGSSYYSLMYYTDLTKTAGWYVIIVVFSIAISLYFISLIVLSLLQTNVLNIAKFKERQEQIKQFFADAKKAKQQKKVNKEKKKQILAEEEKLLSNLQEVSEEEKSLISEEEFQARIKSNNEIRNKIRELQKQQEELRKHQSVFLKKKRMEETINRRPLKPKKQEITIPDKELEEIFKNIELD